MNRDASEVLDWTKAKSIGGDASVLLRFLHDDDDAWRRLEAVRRSYRQSLRGEEVERLGLSTPAYGGGYEGSDHTSVASPSLPPLTPAIHSRLREGPQ